MWTGRLDRQVWNPPADLCTRVLARLFPHAPATTSPWPTLLRATGRGDLPGGASPDRLALVRGPAALMRVRVRSGDAQYFGMRAGELIKPGPGIGGRQDAPRCRRSA